MDNESAVLSALFNISADLKELKQSVNDLRDLFYYDAMMQQKEEEPKKPRVLGVRTAD